MDQSRFLAVTSSFLVETMHRSISYLLEGKKPFHTHQVKLSNTLTVEKWLLVNQRRFFMDHFSAAYVPDTGAA